MARQRTRDNTVRKSQETVGDRIRRFRKTRGLSQTELGERIGISQRVVTYYEREGGTLSPELLIQFAKALGVSTDAILGVDKKSALREETPRQTESLALWRRFRRIEQLPAHDRKTILRMIDALAERTGSDRH